MVLETRFAHEATDRRALKKLAGWATRYTPWASVGEGHCLLLDISGCAHLFGGEEALLADLVARLEAQGFAARAALAETIGAAWALARFAPETAHGAARPWLPVAPSSGSPWASRQRSER